MIEKIDEIVKKYAVSLKDRNIYFRPHIPEKLLRNAIDSYADGVDKEDVLLLIDDTMLGHAKSGGLLTYTTFYWNSNDARQKKVNLSSITDVRYADAGTGHIYINGSCILGNVTILKSKYIKAFTALLREISLYYHPEVVAQTLESDQSSFAPVAAGEADGRESGKFNGKWFRNSLVIFLIIGLISFFIMVGQQHGSIFQWLLWGIGVNLIFSTVAGFIIALVSGWD